jgi:RNA polymerase sigma-70 factor (ECF subfamily)
MLSPVSNGAVRLEPPGPEPAPLPAAPASQVSAAELYHRYASRVHRLAWRLLGNEADADDVTQEVFLHVLEKLPTFRGEASIGTWLYRVALNTALAYRRQRTKARLHRADYLREVLFARRHCRPASRRRASAPERHALEQERRRMIEAAIASLPPPYREVCLLADVEEQDRRAIADRLGLSLAGVRSRLHRARSLLREAVAPLVRDLPRGEGSMNGRAAVLPSRHEPDRRAGKRRAAGPLIENRHKRQSFHQLQEQESETLTGTGASKKVERGTSEPETP